MAAIILGIRSEEVMGEAAMKDNQANVASIMAEISAKVRAEVASQKDKPAAFKGFDADQNARANRRAGELRESEQLRFLNENYDYSLKAPRSILYKNAPTRLCW